MGLSDVRPFFRGRMNSLGFKEHVDAFDDQNVPQSTLDNTYRMDSGPVSSVISGQNINQFSFVMNLRVFQKGGRSNVDLVDRAYSTAETIISDILQPSVRLGTDIKDVQLDTISLEALSGSDDNDLIIELGFTGILICSF